jgi:hypothetical protein
MMIRDEYDIARYTSPCLEYNTIAMAVRKEPYQVPFYDDHAYKQELDPPADDCSLQDPDVLFLSELAQVRENQRDEPIRRVLYRVAGPIRNVEDVQIENTAFRRPIQTQFICLERGDGMRYFERFDPLVHGEWEQIPDTGMTPRGCIEDIYAHCEEFPGIIQQFINKRKEKSASKTHWAPRDNPKPRKLSSL